ncbi:MAG: caspase family protein [Treponema sp.]|nr:caspase family protein [Treponema sp.]
MKKLFLLFLVLSIGTVLFAQQKYALVIGNGEYSNLGRLNNAVNDANDIAALLQNLGFTSVEKVLNGSLEQMETAIIRFKNQLSTSRDAYGFFYYAGHGVQSNGVNYLIPVNANIPTENFLRERAVSVQAMMNEINDAKNELNIIILDACRDNPFSWSRSGTRGLSVVSHQPADSIVVYATSAGSVASDGTGRNGLFTTHLLNHLRTPGLEITEVFRRTMGDVARASNNQQRPAVYNQFPGVAYLNQQTNPTPPPQPPLNPSSNVSVTIVNNTGYLVYFLYISPTSSDTWGQDMLASNQTLPTGQSVSVRLPQPLSANNRYDIQLVDLDGDTYTRYNELLTNNRQVTFTFADFDRD